MTTPTLEAAPTDHRIGGHNLETWSSRSPLRIRHRLNRTTVTGESLPPATSGDPGLVSPLETPDPLTRVYRGTIDFRLEPAHLLQQAPKLGCDLRFLIVIDDPGLGVPSHALGLHWCLGGDCTRHGTLEAPCSGMDTSWKPVGHLKPDTRWHTLQWSLNPSRLDAWLSVDENPIRAAVGLGLPNKDQRSSISVTFHGEPGDPVGRFAFRNWQTTVLDQHHWSG